MTPRLSPEYYAYYYLQRPLDPRLPPPLFNWSNWHYANANKLNDPKRITEHPTATASSEPSGPIPSGTSGVVQQALQHKVDYERKEQPQKPLPPQNERLAATNGMPESKSGAASPASQQLVHSVVSFDAASQQSICCRLQFCALFCRCPSRLHLVVARLLRPLALPEPQHCRLPHYVAHLQPADRAARLVRTTQTVPIPQPRRHYRSTPPHSHRRRTQPALHCPARLHQRPGGRPRPRPRRSGLWAMAWAAAMLARCWR